MTQKPLSNPIQTSTSSTRALMTTITATIKATITASVSMTVTGDATSPLNRARPLTRGMPRARPSGPQRVLTLCVHVRWGLWLLASLTLANPVGATRGTIEGSEAMVTDEVPVAKSEPRPWWGTDPWTSPDRPFLYYGEKRPEPSDDPDPDHLPLPLPQPQVILVSPAEGTLGATPTATMPNVLPVVIGNGADRDTQRNRPTMELPHTSALLVERPTTQSKTERADRAKTTETTGTTEKHDILPTRETAGNWSNAQKNAAPLVGQVVVTPNGDTFLVVGGVAYPYQATLGNNATPTTKRATTATTATTATPVTPGVAPNPSEADAPVPLTTIKTLPELKAERQKRLERAVMNPSPDNMRSYLEVNAFMLGKSHAFAANFERSRLLNPTLDWTATHPTANFAQVEAKEATRTLEERYLKTVSQASALWLMLDDINGESLMPPSEGTSAMGTTDAGSLALQAQFQDLMLKSTQAFAQSYGFPLYVVLRLHEAPESPAFATRLAAWRQRLLSSRVLGLPVSPPETPTTEVTAKATKTAIKPSTEGSKEASTEATTDATKATPEATPSVIRAVLPDLGHTAALGLVELPAVLFIPDMKALSRFPEFVRVKGALAGKDALLLATGVVSSNELARRLMSLLKAPVDPTSNHREVIPSVGLPPSQNPQMERRASTATVPFPLPAVTGSTLGTHALSTQP